jgi:Family of unknown function (DUF6516)
MIDEYFANVRAAIYASPFVDSFEIDFGRRSDEIGFIRGDILFTDGSRLHLREYVQQPAAAPAERYTYVYHYQRSNETMIFRYDNAPHYPNLVNFPHHKHVGSETNIVAAEPLDLASVLKEIESFIGS